MKKVLRIASTVLEVLTVVCFLTLAALVFFQISGRWLRLNNIGWTDEIISCFTSWLVYFGYAYMCERDEHVAITMLYDVIPTGAKTAMVIIVRLANIACGVAMTYGGYVWTRSTATKVTPVLQIHYNIWYSAIWMCGVLFTIFACAKLVETIVSYLPKKP